MSDSSDLTPEMVSHGVRDDDPLITLSSGADSKVFQVKKSVLCAHSEYFKRTFNFDPANLEVTFKSENVSSVALELLVAYMKNRTLEPTVDNVECLIYAANFLKIDKALMILLEFLYKEMEKQNPMKVNKSTLLMYVRLTFVVFEVEQRIGFKRKSINIRCNILSTKKTLIWKFVVSCFITPFTCFKTIMYEKDILDLNERQFLCYVHSDLLNLCEEDLLRFIKVWVRYDYEKRRQWFPSLIRCVRYDPKMKLQFLFDELLCYCKDEPCECLLAKDYVLAVVAKRHGVQGIPTDKGPCAKKPRKEYENITFKIMDK